MPTTKKGNFYCGLMMCVGMVIFMTSYNLVRSGMIGTLSLTEIMAQFIAGFLVAFLLELFVVGPAAKKIVLALPFDKSKKLLFILFMAVFMVLGMVLCMSLFGLGSAYLAGGLDGEPLFESYVSIVANNFLFAFPLQLIVVGPIVRCLFKYKKFY
ncbi:hypothetical protein RB620_12050 [Paenibacillus sp. LHD-117]|uniref:hypothetical protein n=1 Tax=Paenibacillus sp. LHD-117 TaxID=3071412 RepID=UPI0027E0E45B|nr:hypothetical protein [Paenibacillus sp. LHD-117]MDQ6420171.1 hypothetical protein [Paenibacillus sp. LHD-117]